MCNAMMLHLRESTALWYMAQGCRTALFFHSVDFADGIAVHVYNLHNKTPFLLRKRVPADQKHAST